MFGAGAVQHRSVTKRQVERCDVITERSRHVMIFAMHIGSYHTSERHEFRAGVHGGKPAARNKEFDDVRQKRTRFAGQSTTRLIKCEHSVEPTCVERVRRRHTGIAIGTAVPTRNRRQDGYRSGRLFARVYLGHHAVQNRKAPPAAKRHGARAWSDTHAGIQGIEMASPPPTNKAVAQLTRTARTSPRSPAAFPLERINTRSPTRDEVDTSAKPHWAGVKLPHIRYQ